MADHLGRDRRLVDEHKVQRIKRGFLGLQLGTSGNDIGAILFSGVQSVFQRDVGALVEAPH